jgi:hypothetical protein
MAIVKYTKLSLMDLAMGFIDLVFILVAFSISINQVVSASVAFPSYELPTSSVEDLGSDVYDGCMSPLTGKLPEEKASTCFGTVSGDSKDKSDLLPQESSTESSQNIAPEGDGTKSSEEAKDDNKDSHENKEQVTENEKDANDIETDESSQSDEPENQIMIIEGGKKVAEY